MSDSKAKPEPIVSIDYSDLLKRTLKYAFEGLVVAIAAYLIPSCMHGKCLPLSNIGLIGLVALATFAVLDTYAPSVASSARTGVGFGIGAGLVGFP